MAKQTARNIEKVLRIGIIKDREMVNESLIFPGEDVTVGSSPSCTFSIDIEGLPANYSLFQYKNDAFHLQFSDAMDGKIAAGKAGTSGLADLRASDKVSKSGSNYTFKLQENFRGKVTVGEFSFLFQFIPAPPMSMRKQYNYQPTYFGEDDVLFLGFCGLFTMLAAVLLLYVRYYVEITEASQEAVEERFVQLMVPDIPDEEPEPVESDLKSESTEKTPQKPKKKEPEPEKKEAPKETKKASSKSKADRISKMTSKDLQAGKAAAEQTAFMKLLGSRRASGGTALASAFDGKESDKDVMAKLAKYRGDIRADGGSGLAVKGQSDKGGRASTDIGKGTNLGKRVKSGSVGKGPAVKTVRGKTSMKSFSATSGGECKKAIRKVVKKKSGQVRYCYEKRLKENPKLSGRVVVSMSIKPTGKAYGVKVDQNTTGDSALKSCILGKAKRWKFPKDCEEPYTSFSFALAPGN